MSLIWASALLAVALPFLLWPLLRHHEVNGTAETSTTQRGQKADQEARQAALLAIEEVELDAASGRLDPADAGRRLAELRSDAERILRRP